jgi:hypothetical protein
LAGSGEVFSVGVGLAMHFVFRREERAKAEAHVSRCPDGGGKRRRFIFTPSVRSITVLSAMEFALSRGEKTACLFSELITPTEGL